MKKIGFLGLGAMGFPIAYGLHKAGYPLLLPTYRDCTMRGFSPTAPDHAAKKERLAEMLAEGAVGADDQRELVADSEVLFLSLPTSRQVEEVVLGAEGILENGRAGLIVIDLTSADPESTRRLNAALEQKGIELLDAPVSGGTIGASQQTLSVMVGGKREIFARCLELFCVIGAPEKIFYLGPSGAGDVAKCANNFLSAGCFAAPTEALMVCARAGIPPQTAVRLIDSSGGSSSATSHKFPHLIFPGKDMGMSIELMLKDIALFLDASRKYHIPAFLGETVYQLWNLPVAEGKGGKDLKTFIELYEHLCGVTLSGIGIDSQA